MSEPTIRLPLTVEEVNGSDYDMVLDAAGEWLADVRNGTGPTALVSLVNSQAERIEAGYAVERALRGILEIGKRDLSNPKYDGYFAEARAALEKFSAGTKPDRCPTCGTSDPYLIPRAPKMPCPDTFHPRNAPTPAPQPDVDGAERIFNEVQILRDTPRPAPQDEAASMNVEGMRLAAHPLWRGRNLGELRPDCQPGCPICALADALAALQCEFEFSVKRLAEYREENAALLKRAEAAERWGETLYDALPVRASRGMAGPPWRQGR